MAERREGPTDRKEPGFVIDLGTRDNPILPDYSPEQRREFLEMLRRGPVAAAQVNNAPDLIPQAD